MKFLPNKYHEPRTFNPQRLPCFPAAQAHTPEMSEEVA